MLRHTLASFVLLATTCYSDSALAISARAASIEWQTDLSDQVVIASVIRTTPLKPENELWDAQEVVCSPIELLKGNYRDKISFRHIFRNAKNSWEGSAPAVRVEQHILVFLAAAPNKKSHPFEWINLSQPNRRANPLEGHTAYNNDCGVLSDEKSILTAVRERVKTTAELKETKRRGVLLMFKPLSDMYADFIVPADDKYKSQFLKELKSDSESDRCWAIFNLVSYPGEDTVRAIRPMLQDPATAEIEHYNGDSERTEITYPVRRCADIALALLGQKVDRSVLFRDQYIPGPFDTGFEDRVYFPYGNWKRFEDIVPPAPAWPFDFLRDQKAVTQSHDWKHLDYTFAVKADFSSMRKRVEAELLPKGFKMARDDAHGFGRKQKSVEYRRGRDEHVIMFEHMRYVVPESERPYSAVGEDRDGWTSFHVVLGRVPF